MSAVKVLPTYTAEGETTNANAKVMLGLFNPSGSGKLVKIQRLWVIPKSTGGTNVIAAYEIRRSSAQSGGTALPEQKYDTADSAPVAEAVSGATTITVTDVGLMRTLVIQTNTVQGISAYVFSFVNGESKQLVLRPGEGAYIKMVTASNTSTVDAGFDWTEEAA